MSRKVVNLAVLVLLLLPGAATAHEEPHFPGALPVAGADSTVVVHPDTLQVRLVLPESWAVPLSVQIKPDSLLVGQPAQLRLCFPAGKRPALERAEVLAGNAEGIGLDQKWLHWDAERHPATALGDTLVLPVTVYQINPFRVVVADLESPLVRVGLRLGEDDELADVRDPRPWKSYVWRLWLVGLGILILAALALWGLIATRVAREKFTHWDTPAPAWLSGARELAALLDEGHLTRGEARPFLDRLDAVCRRYLSGRFGIGAVEMTPAEIRKACVARGFDLEQVGPFVNMLTEMDALRFDPSPLGEQAGQGRARQLFNSMADVRITTLLVPVRPGDLEAGQQAWNRLAGRWQAPENIPVTGLPESEGGL